MWLQDCQGNPKEFRSCSALCGTARRLRHLLPKPTSSVPKNTPYSLISSSYCGCINNNNNNIQFSMNPLHQNFAANDHQSSKEAKHDHMEHIVSSRWNPTPEQLMALEEMYRRGIRTPSSEEIKLISAKLRQFGKIEGKNVFYWFQNHKARERQKRRRQPLAESSTTSSKKLENDANETLDGNDHKGFSFKYLEGEDQNNQLTTSPKEPETMQKPADTESDYEGEMQQTNQWKMSKGATKETLDLPWKASSNSDMLNTINTTFPGESSREAAADQKMLSALNFNIFSSSCYADDVTNHEDAMPRDHRTLELFPLQKDGCDPCSDTVANDAKFQEFMDTMNPNLPPNHFYEFL